MSKTLIRSALSLTLLTSILAGCGLNGPLATGAGADMQADAAKVKTKYALGAKLTERKVVDDEGGRRTSASLPDSADLRSQCSPVANQGNVGACTAFAIAKGLDEFLAKKSGNAASLSPAFLYYEERKAQGNADMTADSGSTIEVGMKVLEDMGTCPEQDMPFLSTTEKDPAKIKTFLGTAPGDKAIKDALDFRIAGSKPFIQPDPNAKKLKPVSLATMSSIRATLAGGMPVVIGMIVFQSMMGDDVRKTGNLPMPDPQAGDKVLGGHAVMIVGYDQAKQVFIVRNSWSSSWGDKGYFYLPYDYVRAGLVRDAWTATL